MKRNVEINVCLYVYDIQILTNHKEEKWFILFIYLILFIYY